MRVLSLRFTATLIIISMAGIFSTSALAQDASPQGQREHRHAASATSQPVDPHDLSGVWNLRSPLLELSKTPPPFTAWGQAKFDANKPSYGPRAVPPAEGNDAMGNCDPLGLPRLFFYARPIQFVVTPKRIIQFFQAHVSWRDIWTDGRPLPKDPDPTWNGYAIGHWDGDSLIVESTGYDERTWLDHFGDPHSDEMRIEERWHRVDHDTLELSMTLTDPKTYTQPWASDAKIFKLQPDQEVVDEEFCVPSEEQAFNRRIRDLADGKHDPAPSH